MKLIKRLSIFGIMLTLGLGMSAQTNDTLEIARKFYNKKEYSRAASLLHIYLKKHPKDVYTSWLYGQVAHESKHDELSNFLFLRALRIQPENLDLKMDYIRSLFYSKQLKKAQKELKELIKQDHKEEVILEAHLMLGYIDYWNMDLKSASQHVDEILKKNPNDKLALELKEGIEYLTSPHLKVSLDYIGDNQTLNSFSENIEIGMSKSKFLNPKLSIKNQNFDTSEQALTAHIGNTFLFTETGLSVYLSAGVYQHFSDGLGWLGEAELKQKLGNYLYAKAGINRLPYLHTKESTYFSIFENNAYGIVEYENPKLLSFNLLYQHKFFNDDNYINTFGAWVMSKYFKVDFFEFRAGYGFSYSDSKEMAFYPEEPIENLTTSHPLGGQIPGVYNPYFTPNNQIIHSLVGAVKFTVSPKLSLDASGTYGVYAKNDAPILFSDQNAEGNYLYEMSHYKEKYHPFDIKGSLSYLVSDNLTLGAYYQYQETSFFNQNKAGALLFYKF